MPVFTAAFSDGRSLSCESFYIADTSDYSTEGHGTFNYRHIWIYLADRSTMLADGSITTTPTYINFPFSDGDTLTVPLSLDWEFRIRLELDSNNPQAGSTYDVSAVVGSLCYLPQFGAGLQTGTQAQASLRNDSNYRTNLANFYLELDNVVQATTFSVLQSGQNAIDRAYEYVNNQSKYF